MLDFGLEVKPKKFNFKNNYAVLPNSLVASYALAIATSGKASRILLAGFDGYPSDDPRRVEMDEVLSLYQKFSPKTEILSVTNADLYLRKSFVKKADSITAPSTASFTAVTASAPVGLSATSENDFVFFINGQYMEHDALEIQQAGSNFLLKVDEDSIGYGLESDDEIIATGKFNS